MINRMEFGIGGALLLAVLGWAQAQPLTKAAIGGTFLLCRNASECPITVRLAPSAAASGGCIAKVDIERVSVRGGANRAVVWYLAKTDMTDTNEYEFVGDGIRWVNSASAAGDFASQPMSGASAASRWVTKFQGASRPFLDYVPRVHKSKPYNAQECDAGDPKINNDGP